VAEKYADEPAGDVCLENWTIENLTLLVAQLRGGHARATRSKTVDFDASAV
jgi:hypothetical protein